MKISEDEVKDMFQVGTDWNPLQAQLKEIILKKDRFKEIKPKSRRLETQGNQGRDRFV